MAYKEGQTTTDGQYTFHNGGWYKTDGGTPPAAQEPAAKPAAEPTPSTWQDIKDIAGPSLKAGVLGRVTSIPTMLDLGVQGMDYMFPRKPLTEEERAQRFGPGGYGHQIPELLGKKIGTPIQQMYQQLRDPTKPVPLSYSDVAGRLGFEEPEAKTPIGRGVQSLLEMSPSGVGKNIIGKAVTTAGSALGDWIANEASGGNPWARMVGALAGSHIGPGVRTVRTPNPITDPEQLAKIGNVGQDVNLSAGDKVGGTTKWLENYAGKPEEFQPGSLRKQWTQGAMRRLGAPGFGASKQGSDVAKQSIEQSKQELTPALTPTATGMVTAGPQYRATSMTLGSKGTYDPDFEASLNQARAASTHPYPPGSKMAPRNEVDDFIDRIKNDPSGKPQYSLGGANYDNLRGDIQAASTKATDPNIRNGLGGLVTALDAQMEKSLAGGRYAGAWPRNRNQFTDWQAVNDLIEKGQAPEGALNPKQVRAGVGASSPVGKYAEDFSSLTKPSPTAESYLPEILGGVAGLYAGSQYNPNEALTGGIYGSMLVPALVKGARSAGRSMLFRPGTQNWLSNQAWMPSPATTSDPKAMVRALTTQQGIQNYEDTPYQ